MSDTPHTPDDAQPDENPDRPWQVTAFADYFKTAPARDDLDGVYTLDTFADAFPHETRSFRINYPDLTETNPDLADNLLRDPTDYLDYARAGLLTALDSPPREYVPVRVRNLPEHAHYRVGKYRRRDLDTLIEVEGQVIDVSNVQPHAETAAYYCMKCGSITEMPQRYGNMVEPAECESCERKGPWRFSVEDSTLRDWQEIVLIPTDSQAEEPQVIDVHLREDICDRVDKGATVTVTGIYETYPTQNETVLETLIRAVDLDVGEQAAVDAVDQAELDDRIDAAIEEKSDGGFGVPRDEVVAAVSESGIQEREVERRVEERAGDSLIEMGDKVALD